MGKIQFIGIRRTILIPRLLFRFLQEDEVSPLDDKVGLECEEGVIFSFCTFFFLLLSFSHKHAVPSQ